MSGHQSRQVNRRKLTLFTDCALRYTHRHAQHSREKSVHMKCVNDDRVERAPGQVENTQVAPRVKEKNNFFPVVR